MLRYNPPPNWPAPPSGWTPPPGWEPDPEWGPAPAGWQLWLGRPNRRAFLRVGAVALVVYTLLAVLLAVAGAFSAHGAGRLFAPVLLAWLITSTIAYFRRPWGWGAYIGWFLCLFVALEVLSAVGRVSA